MDCYCKTKEVKVPTMVIDNMSEALNKARRDHIHVVLGVHTIQNKKPSKIICGKVINRRGQFLIFDDGTKLANRTGFQWKIIIDFTKSICQDQSSLSYS